MEQGIEAVRSFRPHLALVDFLLPKKNGFAVAEAIRKDPLSKDAVPIAMSGVFKNPRTGVEAQDRYQAVDFLSKPSISSNWVADSRELGRCETRAHFACRRGRVPPVGVWSLELEPELNCKPELGPGLEAVAGIGGRANGWDWHRPAQGRHGPASLYARGGAYVRSVEVSAAALLAEDHLY